MCFDFRYLAVEAQRTGIADHRVYGPIPGFVGNGFDESIGIAHPHRERPWPALGEQPVVVPSPSPEAISRPIEGLAGNHEQVDLAHGDPLRPPRILGELELRASNHGIDGARTARAAALGRGLDRHLVADRRVERDRSGARQIR
jgi:hypothetical protein